MGVTHSLYTQSNQEKLSYDGFFEGSSVEADSALEGKDLILFYFSAHWCPPCRQFTPMLKDRSNEDMLSYMKESHGDWLATEHGSSLTDDLKQKFGIQGIPTLVVVKPDGTLVTKDGRAHVCSKQPKQAVEGWKN